MIEHFRKRSVAHQILLLNVALMAFLCLTHQSFIGKGAMGETLMSFKIPQNVKTFVGERSWLFLLVGACCFFQCIRAEVISHEETVLGESSAGRQVQHTSNRIASQTIAAFRCLAGAKYLKNSRDFYSQTQIFSPPKKHRGTRV
jgi:hypothetical protein